jgi:hypothetical protein
MRTLQDLLAERRATIAEQSRERDPAVKALCQYTINEIDREVHARTRMIDPRDSELEHVAAGWSPAFFMAAREKGWVDVATRSARMRGAA